MHTGFTHILLFVMAAGWLFASCSSDVPDGGTVMSGSEVQFAASGVSRASVSTNLNHAGSQFAVFGDMKLAGSSSPECIVVFNGAPVSCDGSKWAYANTQYWFPNYEHSFVALHPFNPGGVSDMAYSNSSLSFNYTLPEAFGDTPDLLVAAHRRMYEEQTSSSALPVTLMFTHTLSRVNFLVKNDKAAKNVRVTKIEFAEISKSGTLTFNPASLASGSKQTDDYNLSWTASQSHEALVADTEVDIPENEETSLFPDNNALFVIPQPDNNGVIMKISYTLTYNNGKTEERTLAAETRIGGWLPGKVYTYSLSIASEIKVIEMNVSVKDWDTGPKNEVTVPRK